MDNVFIRKVIGDSEWIGIVLFEEFGSTYLVFLCFIWKLSQIMRDKIHIALARREE